MPDEPAAPEASAEADADANAEANAEAAPVAAPDAGAAVSAGPDLVATARARHGTKGAVLAAGMLGLDQVLGRPAKEEIPVVWEAGGEPTDIDHSGISVPVDADRSVQSQPGRARAGRPVPKRRR